MAAKVYAVVATYERAGRITTRVVSVCASIDAAARECGKLAVNQLESGAPIGEYAYHIDAGGSGMGFEVVE